MNRKFVATFLSLAVVCLGISGCGHDEPTSDGVFDTVSVTGTVGFFVAGGRCWCITTDDHTVFEVTNLPSAFQSEGLTVRARLQIRDDLASVCMLGPITKVVDIERAQ